MTKYQPSSNLLLLLLFCSQLKQYSSFLTTVILVLFLYYRKAPEIKATSPYLSLTMFLGCYSLLASGTIGAISPSVLHDWVFFCNAPEWCLSLGLHLIVSPLIMKMLRVYHIFSYFGKLGKRWSDVVLFAGVLALFGANITVLTLRIVFGGRNGINRKRLLMPEDSFHYYKIIRDCTPPSIIASTLYDGELLLLDSAVILLAILNKKYPMTILQRHKESQYIHLLGYSSYTSLPLAQVISDDRIHMFASVNSTAILCQTFLFLPKCLPPLLRHINWNTTTQNLKANRKEILYSHQ